MKLTYVFLSFWMLGLFTSCVDKHPKADMVIFNGLIHTLNKKEPRAEALAIVDGKIVYVGNNLNANNWVGDSTKILDLNKKTVVPGFIDGHAHLMGVGYNMMNLDLSKTNSYEEIIAAVKAKASSTKKGEWIIGRGWHQEKWDSIPSPSFQGFPTNDSLSAVSPNNPVVLMHASGHLILVNQKALKLAKITKKTTNPEGGEIFRNEDDLPTGILNESATQLVQSIIPEPSDEKRIEALNHAIEEYLSHGVTAVHDAGIDQKTIALYESFYNQNMLHLRVNAMLDGSDSKLLDHWFQTGPKVDNDFLTVRTIKLYADGALGSRGALMLEPYSDAPEESGKKITTADQLLRVSERAYETGFQVAIHCIGDAANKAVLNIYKIVFQSDTTKVNPRFRIEHAQHIAADDIPRFGEMGVIPSMQAIHMSSDRPWAIHRIGEERIKEGAYVWRKLIDSGATVMNGTDAPVEPVSVLANFYASITRKTLSGDPEDGFEGDQKMTRLEALESLTINNAYGAFQEDIKGCIEIGKVADLTILSQDIMSIPEEDILKTEIEYTIVDGQVRYKK
ncbi:amidohydrolase [Reichenbachiella agariperforans]|uniref:amidohydrolase n=1 Tax=Reichenbachiella agariperforans TaxID=156994 RepID=UPI001C09077D|nr:amidohydrolase [Reichenbachiella agariperforans]MBU2912784.1 amidohydrolase [Reichenbachiella agariperforans]